MKNEENVLWNRGRVEFSFETEKEAFQYSHHSNMHVNVTKHEEKIDKFYSTR